MAANHHFTAAAAEKHRHIVPLNADGTGPSLICFPGSGGNIHIFREMVAALPEGCPVHGIDLEWLCEQNEDFTVEQLATFYIDVVKSVGENGPYLLCGYSFGGLRAYELAVRLIAEGYDVAAVALLDAPNPALLSNLSTSEAVQYRRRYLIDRLRRYRDHLWRGDFGAFASRGLAFFISRTSQPLLPLIKIGARLTGRRLPTIVRSNDPGFLKAWNAYVPKPCSANVVCFRVDDRGDEDRSDPSMGWSTCASRGVEIHTVPGGHVGMMTMPSVQVISDVLATYLSKSAVTRREAVAARS
jgi:thioesterase domain-containing protein